MFGHQVALQIEHKRVAWERDSTAECEKKAFESSPTWSAGQHRDERYLSFAVARDGGHHCRRMDGCL